MTNSLFKAGALAFLCLLGGEVFMLDHWWTALWVGAGSFIYDRLICKSCKN